MEENKSPRFPVFSEQCPATKRVRLTALIIAAVIAIIFILFSFINTQTEYEKTYDKYYGEVNDFIKHERKSYRAAMADGNERNCDVAASDVLLAFLTLGIYSRNDPHNYKKENDYLLAQAKKKYSSFLAPEPKIIIAKGIINGWSRKKTIREIKKDDDEHSLVPYSLVNFIVIVFSIFLFGILYAVVLTVTKAISNRGNGYIRVYEHSVRLNGGVELPMRDISSVRTTEDGSVAITANNTEYRRGPFGNSEELARTITEAAGLSDGKVLQQH